MIELTNVAKAFDGVAAVDGVDLVAARGDTTVLIGPSGCGKSTLLRLMNGLLLPDSGRVRFDGTALTAENVREVRRRVGYVIQDGGLFPHLTARGNVTLMARWLGLDPEVAGRRLDDLVDLTHFPESGLDRYPAELSGGQSQRVSLMRALMLEPEVLLLDEPMGALDPMVRSELQSDLREIFDKVGATVVLVTHDLSEAAYLADTIVLMRNGRIEQSGSVAELVESPADEFVARFVSAQRSAAWPLESE